MLAPGLPFAPAVVDPAVDAVVYQALFEERCFRARYQNAKQQTKEHIVHPLSLVVRMPQRYLVCTIRDGQPPIHLALARIRSAELLERPREVPPGFDLTEFLRRGELDVPLSAAPIHLRFRIHSCDGFCSGSRGTSRCSTLRNCAKRFGSQGVTCSIDMGMFASDIRCHDLVEGSIHIAPQSWRHFVEVSMNAPLDPVNKAPKRAVVGGRHKPPADNLTGRSGACCGFRPS